MTNYEQYIQKIDQINALKLALATMSYDLNTIAPIKGSDYRNKMMAILGADLFAKTLDPSLIELAKQLKEESSDPDFIRELSLLLNEYDRYQHVPKELNHEFQQLSLDGFGIWHHAKETDNYAHFEPTLLKLVELKKQITSYFPNNSNPYDALLDIYSEGLTQSKLDYFFDTLQSRLVPFIKKITEKQIPRPEFLSRPVPLEKQRQVTELIRHYLQFDPASTYISESAHPFSSTFSLNDSRITTKYIENDFISNIFSIIHEIGHGTYNQQVNPKFEGWLIADAMSMSMHESQSRFLENNIARSKEFWIPLYSQLQQIVSPALDDVSLDEFIFGINYSTPSLIRIEADELTYPLHVLIRYRMEQWMLSQSDLSNLNKKWAELYTEYLGVTPSHDAQGILQDVHWSSGDFGYFPTYALGSAYAAQFYHQLNTEINVSEVLAQGHYGIIKEWLKENIHQFGASLTDKQVIDHVTHQDFDPNYYCDYLINKFSKLYQLD